MVASTSTDATRVHFPDCHGLLSLRVAQLALLLCRGNNGGTCKLDCQEFFALILKSIG